MRRTSENAYSCGVGVQNAAAAPVVRSNQPVSADMAGLANFAARRKDRVWGALAGRIEPEEFESLVTAVGDHQTSTLGGRVRTKLAFALARLPPLHAVAGRHAACAARGHAAGNRVIHRISRRICGVGLACGL